MISTDAAHVARDSPPSPTSEDHAHTETAPALLWGGASPQNGAPTDTSWLLHGYLAPEPTFADILINALGG
jgi:hypothetical protein